MGKGVCVTPPSPEISVFTCGIKLKLETVIALGKRQHMALSLWSRALHVIYGPEIVLRKSYVRDQE